MSTTMGVGGGSVGSNNAATGQAASQTSVDYDAFLKLLVTQLKNQDPTEPMDSTQYLAQLASFSQVEQSVQTNAKLDQLLTSSAIEQANQMIGRTLTSADGSTSGAVSAVRITSQGLIARLADGTEMAVGSGVTITDMNEADAFEIVRSAIWTILVASGPAVGAAMIVGIGIALFQALTQIQEVTLTFIPKIVVILLMTALTGTFIGAQIFAFTSEVYARIGSGF